MKNAMRILALAAFFALFGAERAGAATGTERMDCRYGPTHDLVVSACTAVASDVTEILEDRSRALYERGSIYFAEKDFNAAFADYRRAISLDPNNASAFIGRGLVYLERGKREEAEADCRHGLSLSPDMELGKECFRGLGLVPPDFRNEQPRLP